MDSVEAWVGLFVVILSCLLRVCKFILASHTHAISIGSRPTPQQLFTQQTIVHHISHLTSHNAFMCFDCARVLTLTRAEANHSHSRPPHHSTRAYRPHRSLLLHSEAKEATSHCICCGRFL